MCYFNSCPILTKTTDWLDWDPISIIHYQISSSTIASAGMKSLKSDISDKLPTTTFFVASNKTIQIHFKYVEAYALFFSACFAKGKSLLELWVTTVLPDWQLPLIAVWFISNFLCMCSNSMASAHMILKQIRQRLGLAVNWREKWYPTILRVICF